MDFIDLTYRDLAVALIAGMAVHFPRRAYGWFVGSRRGDDMRRMIMADIGHQAHYLLLLGEQFRKAAEIINGEGVKDGYFEVAPLDTETYHTHGKRCYSKVFSPGLNGNIHDIYHLVDSLSKISPADLVNGYAKEAAGRSEEEIGFVRRKYADKLVRAAGMMESIHTQIVDTLTLYREEQNPKGRG